MPVWWQNVYPSLRQALDDRDYTQACYDLLWLGKRLNAYIDAHLIADDPIGRQCCADWHNAAKSIADFSLLSEHPLKPTFVRVRNLIASV